MAPRSREGGDCNLNGEGEIRTLPGGGENVIADVLTRENGRWRIFGMSVNDTKCQQKRHVLSRFHGKGETNIGPGVKGLPVQFR